MDNVRRFKKVKIALMRSKQFSALSGLMMLGKTTLTDAVPTACTNGRDELYNPLFVFRFDNNKMAGFIIVHENMHKAGRHMWVYKKLYDIDPQLANAACDYWINQKIVDADPGAELVEMPRDEDGKQMGLLDAKYKGWTVLQIFNDLRENQEKQSNGFDEHDWEGAAQMGEQEAKELEQDIKQAIRQGQMAARKAGNGSADDLLGLGELLRSRVDWRAQLREFVNSTCADKQESSWRRPNRRHLQYDMIMPTLQGESIREVVLARDASGSMFYKDRLTQVTSEMVAIVNALHIERVHLLDWDGKVGQHEIMTSEQFKHAPQVKQVHGGGGTDPTCVTDYLRDKKIKPDAVVVLTDGEVLQWGKWDCPVLWVIANETTVEAAPIGKTIHITE